MRISDWSSDVCSSDLVVADVLAGDRPPRDVVADAKAMRDDMAAHKPPAGPLDAKLLPGGLVDLEFAVHVQQLVHRTGFDPHLGRAIDVLAAAGLMPPAMRAAHDFLSRLLVTTRCSRPTRSRSEEHTSELQSLMRISYAVFCL